MRLSLDVRVNGQYLQEIGARIDVPELYQECFEPIDKCDDRFMAAIAPQGATNEAAKIVMKTREDAADILAKELAYLIVNEMKKHDTTNGYKD
jgi:hypothetical protein